MTDQSMFDETKETHQETPDTTPSSDPFEDKLKEITNENGEPKYKDVATAIEALKNSQQFIETLKTEKRTVEEQYQAMKAEMEKMGNIEDFVNRLKPDAEPKKEVETKTAVQGLSEEEVRKLLEQSLSQREKQSAAENNLRQVTEAVSQMHGDKATSFIKERAKALQTTPAALKELAQSNPTMALTLLGGDVKPSSKSSPSTSIPPMQAPNDNPKPVFEKGVSRGGMTNAELVARWREVGEYTNKRIGVET